MEHCLHNWNGEFENKCQCTKCLINHDWKEIERREVWETHYIYNEDSGGKSYDFTGTSFDEEVSYITYKCSMCGKQKEETTVSG